MKQRPDNLKFKKYHKINKSFLFVKKQKSVIPSFGNWGLKSVSAGKLTYRQIEAGRKTIRRNVSKGGSLWVKAFTYAPVSQKPNGIRMGKGKGLISHWVCPVKKGQIIYELSGLSFEISLRALYSASIKLPVKTKIIKLIY